MRESKKREKAEEWMRGKPAVQHCLNYSSTSEWVAACEEKRGGDIEGIEGEMMEGKKGMMDGWREKEDIQEPKRGEEEIEQRDGADV